MSWDKRTLRRREPCKQCPFRRVAPPGYLGGHSLDTYAQPPSVGMPTTCHKGDRGASDPRSSYCAGALGLINNDPGIEPLPEYAEAAAQIGLRDDCFESAEAFREHHRHADRYAVRHVK
jgi:hypothetical protein